MGCASDPVQEPYSRPSGRQQSVHVMPDMPDAISRIDGQSTLDDYLNFAFTHSPALKADFDRWKASLERIPQARSLDDPALSFEYFVRQMDTRYQVGLTQMFPAFGTLDLREKRAAAEAEAAMHRFEAERLMLFDRVVKAFYEYHYLSRAIQLTEENYRLLADLEQVVASRYKTGLAPFSEFIKTQVEKDRLANDLSALQDERSARSAGLAALLNLPVYDVLAWPKMSPSGTALVDVDVLNDMLEELNPELKGAGAMIAAETYRERLARRNALPEVMLGASWMVMPGMNDGNESDVGLMAGISLPLWRGKYRAEVREAAAMVRAATSERDNMQNMLKAELSMAIFKVHDAERRIALFSGSLIPKATQALEVSNQEYKAGKSGFMTLIDAGRTWLEFSLMLERATVDREIALGEIGCCIGKYAVETAETEALPAGRTQDDEREGE